MATDNTDRIMKDLSQTLARELVERKWAYETPTVELPFLMNESWLFHNYEKTYHRRLASAYREVFGADPVTRN